MSEAQNHERMDATLPVDTFREFYDAVAAMSDEAKFRFTEDGLSVRVVDPANVGMVDADLSAKAFDGWTEHNHTVGLGLSDIGKYLKTAPEESLLTLSPSDSDHVRFGLDGFDFRKAWIDPDKLRKEPDLPTLTLPADVSLPIGQLRSALRRADIVANHVILEVDPDENAFIMTTEDDGDEGYYRATPDDHLTVHKLGEAFSWFTLDYLCDMVEAIPDGVDVRLQIGEEFPLIMEHEIADGLGSVKNLLAPRIGGPD